MNGRGDLQMSPQVRAQNWTHVPPKTATTMVLAAQLFERGCFLHGPLLHVPALSIPTVLVVESGPTTAPRTQRTRSERAFFRIEISSPEPHRALGKVTDAHRNHIGI